MLRGGSLRLGREVSTQPALSTDLVKQRHATKPASYLIYPKMNSLFHASVYLNRTLDMIKDHVLKSNDAIDVSFITLSV